MFFTPRQLDHTASIAGQRFMGSRCNSDLHADLSV